MSETEQKKEPDNQLATELWDRLGKELTTEWVHDIENLMKSNSLEHEGETYKFQWVPGKDIIKFKKLDADSFKIKDKDGQEWYDNVKARACVIIQGMTSEKFDAGDYVIFENLTTAWSSRAIRGFHRAQPGTQNDLPNGQKTTDGL